jgi:hypothetical protein
MLLVELLGMLCQQWVVFLQGDCHGERKNYITEKYVRTSKAEAKVAEQATQLT